MTISDETRSKLSAAAKARWADPASRLRAAKERHGHTKGGRRSPTYATWQWVVSACENPRAMQFDRYGGAGTSVDPTWVGKGGFQAFLEAVGPRPGDDHRLALIDPRGNFTKSNVQWVPKDKARIRKGPNSPWQT